ncbi:hypothetical protein C8F04DRAFT_1140473 [Mycena alexandri]|uniref:Uncharacterized protein n=1 Tax=Mycena alexandri TaxID=1745969 RepID=A0AAD6S847_9AGAR|nr:hypothetical protein C8F04DRAFT_1140473 [Mycena alexandri]
MLYVALPSTYTILRLTCAIHAAAPHPTHRLRALPEDRHTNVYLRAPTNGYAHAKAVRAFGGCRAGCARGRREHPG